ncbi:olfactory receptor 14C36-like, partial [Mus pahari]|uniref:olfactory receptor 14C36-like n=1 Tax=Mus pahari TaxID=10093 RepID=UPI000A30E00A
MANSTLVTEFLLEVFAETWELRILLSVLFLLVYMGSLLGNLIIIIATTVDQTLKTPMYFFLRNLSILDMGFVSVTAPHACINSLTDHRNISLAGCAAQIFLVFFSACVEIQFLTIMAQDRYVAICKPLLYPMIMNHQFCVQMTSLLTSLILASVHTSKTFQLSFCHSNLVSQFFCDIPSLLRLSCTDTFNNKLLLLLSAIGLSGSCFTFIAISYVRILST